MNCRRRGAAPAAKSPIKENVSRDGGDMKTYGDKHGMERHGAKPESPMKSGVVIEHAAR